MNLVDSVVDLGQRAYEIDWSQVQTEVIERLHLDPQAASGLLDPRRHPTYWCVPLLVGDYVHATAAAVREDVPPFLAGCLVRHFAFEPDAPLEPRADEPLVWLIKEAYDANRAEHVADTSFAARFGDKCRPWSVLLGVGTESIRAEVRRPEDYHEALRAIVRVYSCLQLVDDWHDRADDAARAHWNCWTDEPLGRTLAAVEPLMAGARSSVAVLRPGLLRRALTAQLQDAAADLAEIIDDHPLAFLQQRRAAGSGALWRDFEVAGVSRGSTECISAFIAAQLAPLPSARSLVENAVRHLLSNQRSEAGWGYREDVPADCDSTAWVMIAAAAAGFQAPEPVRAAAQAFILEHQDTLGGFATYRQAVRGRLSPGDRPGWFAPEVSVTASALLALLATGYDEPALLRRIGDHLVAARTGDLWTSYWWQGFAYPTMVACWALEKLDPVRYDAELCAASEALWAAQRPDGGWAGYPMVAADPFTTALTVQTLIRIDPSGARSRLHRSVTFLLAQRAPAGGYRPGAAMLAPGAGDDGADLVLRDGGCVTTATVLAALHAQETATRRRG